MKRTVRKVFGTFLAAAGGALLMTAAPGCAESESVLFIRQAQIPQQSSGGGCVYDSSASTSRFLSGVLDVSIRTQYTAGLLVGNQMVDRGSKDDLRTETSRVQLEGTEVYVKDASGNRIAGPYTVPGTGLVDPASGSNPSFGLITTVLIDSVTGSRLANDLAQLPYGTIRRLTSHVKVFGRTLGGTEVESGEWQFPIDVCYGCLVRFPTEANNPNYDTPNCLNLSGESQLTTPCNPGQDDPIDCRVCKLVASDPSVCEPSAG